MPENIVNKINNGKTYNYEELKGCWDKIKNNPQNNDYGFLGSVFAFDGEKNDFSKEIYNKIAGSDEKEGISSKDIDNLANLNKSDMDKNLDVDIKDITEKDFQVLYGGIVTQKIKESAKKGVKNQTKWAEDFYHTVKKSEFIPFYLKKDGKYLSDPEERKIVSDKVEVAKQRIIKYASEHPEDKKIQEYAELAQKTKFTLAKSSNAAAECKIEGGKELCFYYNSSDYYASEKFTTTIMLHELEHLNNNDALDSKKEELAATKSALEEAHKIYNTDNIYGNDKAFLDAFAEKYQGYSDNSPGYGGLPEGLGVCVDGEIKSVEKNKDGYVIKASAGNQETTLTVSLNKDGTPEKGERVTITCLKGGSVSKVEQISEYNPVTKTFDKIDEIE